MTAQVPFPDAQQLNNQLNLNINENSVTLTRSDIAHDTLPGQARVLLNGSELDGYVRREHSTPELDTLAPWLWLVSTPRSSHISALHHQAARGRRIVVVENPQLHLVWYYDQIFIKPLPRYLLSHAFWQYLERQPRNLQQSIIGFVRSYSHLVRYESDFRIAIKEEHSLIPKDDGEEDITWDRFAAFIASFDQIRDDQVNPRYRYGELRLSRLNFYTRIFLPKMTFHHIHAQWRPFLGQMFTPLLSSFAVLTIILNAMQVELAVEAITDKRNQWLSLIKLCRYMSILVLVLTGTIIVIFGITVIFLLIHELMFARSVIQENRKGQVEHEKLMKSGGV